MAPPSVRKSVTEFFYSFYHRPLAITRFSRIYNTNIHILVLSLRLRSLNNFYSIRWSVVKYEVY